MQGRAGQGSNVCESHRWQARHPPASGTCLPAWGFELRAAYVAVEDPLVRELPLLPVEPQTAAEQSGGLQPYVTGAVTVCDGGCNRM